jgi:hypothetical protein
LNSLIKFWHQIFSRKLSLKDTLKVSSLWMGVGLWCLTPLSTIFQLYHVGHFYCWRNPNTRRKPQVTDKLYHVMYRRAPDKLRICVFYAIKTSINACIIISECTHYAYCTYCCVSKLSKFGAYLYADNTVVYINNTFLFLRNSP